MTFAAFPETPLLAAVRKAGGQSAFGRIVGKRQSTIRDWLAAGKPLPAEAVLTVEAGLGLSRHFLRPDIYPLESVANATHFEGAIAANGIPCESADAAIAA